MAWESDQEAPDAGRDWSKLLWYGLALVVAIMLLLLFVPEGGPASQSRARVWHILIPISGLNPEDADTGLTQILSLRQRVVDGESFSSLAREYSGDEDSASRGGDLGWVVHSELADGIDGYIWTAPLNEISDVIQTGFGFHIVLVTDREIAEAEQYERSLHDRVIEESSSGDQP